MCSGARAGSSATCAGLAASVTSTTCKAGLYPSSGVEALPFKGVRAVRLRGTAARTERTTGTLRRAGRVGRGWVSPPPPQSRPRSEEHTSELQSLMRISYAVFCLKKKQISTRSGQLLLSLPSTKQYIQQHDYNSLRST